MTLAYDIKLMRPGCPLVQVALGGTCVVGSLFPTETWLLYPSADMHLYEVNQIQLEHLVKMTKEVVYDIS